ncbi:MAG: hypothetical protein HOO95_05245 [Gallionella sp.]|nr:hypothetical protein [Gallionella sp.]
MVKMKIYQIYYDDQSKSALNPNFIPFNNTHPEKPFEFEYGVMRKLYFKSDTFSDDGFLGVMSWKFQQKTYVSPAKFIGWMEWMHKKKVGDIYTINPYPHESKIFENVWQQGNHFHPGLLDFACEMFDKAGIDKELLTLKHPPSVACYCNYWVAKQSFWDVYMSYTEKLYKAVYESDAAIQNYAFRIQADKKIKSGMFSFLFERMFSTVLAKHQEEFKVYPYYI